MRKKAIHPILTVLLCLAAFTGCARQPQLTVINQSSAPLTNLVMSGSGFSARLSTLDPGEQTHVGGRHYWSAPDCYCENSPLYRVTATVRPDFTVNVDVSTKNY